MFDLGFAIIPNTNRLLDMLDSLDKQRLHKLLSDTIPLLCKNTLGCSLELSVEAFIGITLSGENASEEVVMVSFKETLLADGRASSYVWSEVAPSSPGPPSPLIEPVAFNVSQSGKAERASLAVDNVDGNANCLERHGECSPNWVDDRYWAESSEAAVDNVVPVVTFVGAKGATGTSVSSHSLSFPVKAEANDDVIQAEDESENFETEADLENSCDTGSGYENPYASVVRHCSPVPHSYANMTACQRYLSTAGRSLPTSSQRSRKVTSQRGAARSLLDRHLMSSSCSRPHTKMKAAACLAMNASVNSRHSEVCKIYEFAFVNTVTVNSRHSEVCKIYEFAFVNTVTHTQRQLFYGPSSMQIAGLGTRGSGTCGTGTAVLGHAVLGQRF